MASEPKTAEGVLTFKYRLLANKRQHRLLTEILESQRQLYNAALESRIDCYRKTGRTLSYIHQCADLTVLRKDKDYSSLTLNIQRATIKRLDLAFRAFFRRVKKKQNPGFPRFKGKNWWNSFGFQETDGLTFDGKRLRFKGMSGGIRVHLHRSMPKGKILSCQFWRNKNGWYVCFKKRISSVALQKTGRIIGLDMGLKSLGVLSNGEVILNPRIAARHERELRIRQRHLARCKKGSNGRKKAREAVAEVHTKIRNARQTYLHQISAKLVRDNDIIAIENLNVKGMSRSWLAKSIHDASWGQLREYLTYKAEKAGRELIAVDPKNTTQACSGCGVIVPKKLSDRWHNCPECGLSLDRDHNAALFILARSGAKASQDKAVAYV